MKGGKIASSEGSESNSSKNKEIYVRECKRKKMEETNPESHGKLIALECWKNSVCNVESNSSDVCDSGVEILRDMSIVNKVSLESSFASDQENMNETIPREKRKRKQLSKSTPEQKENSTTSPSHDARPKDIFFAGGFAIHRRKKTSLSSGKDAFAVLSDEMVIQVFRWLPKATLRNCAQVSRRWNRLSSDESLWSRIDLGGSGRTLLPDALSHVLSRGVQVLRLASSEIPDPVFDIHSKFVMENEISKVQYLDLSMANISRDGVAKLLGSCRHLRKLSLEQNQLGDESCIAIGKNINLEVLNLCSCSGITEVGLKSILTGCVRLQSFNLAWTGLSLSSLNILCDNMPPILQRVNLSGCRKDLSDSHVQCLIRRCPELVELDLSDCTQLTGKAVNAVVEGLNKIEYLALSRCYNIPSSAYLSLASAESLMYLDVFGLMSEQSLATLQSSLSDVDVNKFFFSSVARPTVGIRRTSIWGLRVRD